MRVELMQCWLSTVEFPTQKQIQLLLFKNVDGTLWKKTKIDDCAVIELVGCQL